MNIGDILSGIKNLGTIAAGTVGSLLSSADKAIIQPAQKTLSDYFAPSATKGPGGVATPDLRIRDVLREIPGATYDVGKGIAKGATTFGVSAGEVIPTIPFEVYSAVTGKPSPIAKPYEAKAIPGLSALGPIESYQNVARKAVLAGESPVGAILKGAGSAVLDEPTGVVLKPLALAAKPLIGVGAMLAKGGAGKATEEAVTVVTKFLLPENSAQKEVFDKSAKWLTDWVAGKKVKPPTPEVETYLAQFKPEAPVTLFRGAGEKDPKGLASWTYNGRTAKEMSIESGKKGAQVLEQKIHPDNILVDVNRLPEEVKTAMLSTIKDKKLRNEIDMYLSSEGEVVVRPTTTKLPQETGIVEKGRKVTPTGEVAPSEPVASVEGGKDILNPAFNADAVFQKNLNKYKTHDAYMANKYEGFADASGVSKLGIKDEAIQWLDNWLKAKPSIPSKGVVDQLGKYKPEAPTTIYSGNSIGELSMTRTAPTSFTTDIEVAKQFGSAGRRDNPAIIRIDNVKPADISVVVDSIPRDVLKALGHDTSYAASEHEVVSKSITDLSKKYGISISTDGGKTWNALKTVAPKVVAKAPKGVQGAKSVGEILAEGGGKKPPRVPRETVTGPIPGATPPERQFITRVKEMAPEISDILKGKYEKKSNKELVAGAEKIISENYAKAETMARTGIDDQSVAIANKLIEDELNIARNATDEATKNKAYALAAEIANDAAKNLTEAGRAVQAASLLGKMTPEGMARYAARQIQKYNEQAGERTLTNFLGKAKKIPELTGEQLKEITDTMTEINKMEDGIDKARALQKLGTKIQTYIPSTIYQKIINVWKAGLLTGLKTTGVNIASNFAHAVTEISKDVPASAVDAIASLFTGKRTLVLTTKETGKGAAEGVVKGWDYLKTGFDERNIADKLDYKKVNFGSGPVAKVLKGYTDTVFGLLGAEDQPFYYAAKMRSLANQASAMAKNEGLKGKTARDFAQHLIENPTDEMSKYATLDAETAVFQQDSWLARKAQNMQKGLEIILPFAKTPANVATAMINYTPVGIVKTIIENIGKGRFDQRLFSQGIGRGITGTAALAIGAALMGNKLMNLSTPTSEKERKQWELEGRIPNSIKMGDKWRNIGVLGPVGMVLIIGGHLRDGIENTGSFVGGLAQAAGGFGSALTEQSFLSGVNKAIDAIKDPTRSFQGFASSLAGSIVPTLIADIARGTDQYERRSDGMIERIQSRIPGAREGLEPKVDTFGNIIETPNFFEVMADPTRPGNASTKDEPIIQELRRLSDSGYPATPTMLGGTTGYKSLTPEQNTDLWKTGGNFAKMQVQKVMSNPQYKRWDDEKKSKEIAKAVDDSKVEARARIIYSATKGLTGVDLKQALSTYKEDKLLTKQVYARYTEIKRFGK